MGVRVCGSGGGERSVGMSVVGVSGVGECYVGV